MKRSRFTEEQITCALRQHDAGTPMADICRQLGVSEASFYPRKNKHVHMGVCEVKELHQLREETARLKPLVADLTLDKQILTDVVEKALMPARRRELAQRIVDRYPVSVRRACGLGLFSRAAWYRKSRAPESASKHGIRSQSAVGRTPVPHSDRHQSVEP